MDNKEHNGKQRDRPEASEICRNSRLPDIYRLREQVTAWSRRWGADSLLAVGALLVSFGVGCIYPPAGLIAGGALLIAGGILWARGGDGP